MKTNQDKLVMQSVQGKVHHPSLRMPGYRVGFDGKGRIVPNIAAITYNFFIGDTCMGLMGDHIEPGVSSQNPDAAFNNAYLTMACIGNTAKVITGDAKGAEGIVTGKHGGADHVMIAFDAKTLDKLTLEDQFLIKSYGLGLELEDYPEIDVMNMDPSMLKKLNIIESNGILEVPVAKIIPACLMGSGLGSSTMVNGDYDIMARDPKAIEQYHLNELRFGDIVYIQDHCCSYGPDYLEGAGTVGVICHSDSFTSGHGPGVTVIMTSRKPLIKPVLSAKANLADIFKFKK